jgi:4a-hydroxytetrahydrobiopterin dehydratase
MARWPSDHRVAGRTIGLPRGAWRPLGPAGTPRSMGRLEDDRIAHALGGLVDWRRDGDQLLRELTFASFRDAIDFIDRVAELAESADHHPELRNVHRRVEVRLSSHDVGGITERDVALARAIDAVVGTGG